MEYLTYLDIKNKIEKDLDTEDEDFIQPEELLGYVNAGIDEAEAEINGLYEDYFLTYAPISLVSGQELYTLPSGIYALKVRQIIYANGNDIYEVKRMRGKKRFIERRDANYTPSSNWYRYMMINSTGLVPPKILLVPPAQETTADALEVWHIRNANRMVSDTSICDIPEFVEFIIQFAKCEVLKKEGHPNTDGQLVERERLRKLMIDTLANMVDDEETKIEPDMSFYEEMS